MIDKLLDIAFWIATAVVNLLPTYTPSHSGDMQLLVNALATFNNYLPFVEMAECIVAYLAFSVLLLGLRPILKWGRLA